MANRIDSQRATGRDGVMFDLSLCTQTSHSGSNISYQPQRERQFSLIDACRRHFHFAHRRTVWECHWQCAWLWQRRDPWSLLLHLPPSTLQILVPVLLCGVPALGHRALNCRRDSYCSQRRSALLSNTSHIEVPYVTPAIPTASPSAVPF